MGAARLGTGQAGQGEEHVSLPPRHPPIPPCPHAYPPISPSPCPRPLNLLTLTPTCRALQGHGGAYAQLGRARRVSLELQGMLEDARATPASPQA